MLQLLFPDYPTKVALSSSQRERYYIFSGDSTGFHARGKLVPDKYLLPLSRGKSVIHAEDLCEKVVPIAWHKGTDKRIELPKDFLTEHKIVEILATDKTFTPKQAGNAIVVLARACSLEPILANPKAAGTEKAITINNNYLYQGGNGFVRKKIVDVLRKYFIEELRKQGYSNLVPRCVGNVHITYTFTCDYGSGNWDLDNHTGFYTKVLQDVLRDYVLGNDTIETVVGKTVYFEPTGSGEDNAILVQITAV